MTTITKEWLQQTIAEFENTRDDIPFGLSDNDAKVLIVLKRALASLTAEPVRYLNKFSGTCVTLEQQPNASDDVAVYMPLYAAPPVPVVPDEWTIQDAVKFCRETGRQDAGSAMEAWNACRAAMLNGGKS
ncbi:Eaa protein [Salmonella enterica subsp. enterica serovar Eastbourne]|nr:Eaa protein [Salmonella enterica]EDT5697719.1 Eaa protein [Salmonella enterica subsp. enterica serovar Eastbourne]EEG9160757.1 Eaa protein [Salmonella enterica]